MNTVNRRRSWLQIGLLAVALVSVGWLIVSLNTKRNLVAASVPISPSKDNFPREFAFQIEAAEKMAAGYWRPERGLIELSRIYQANGFYAEASRCLYGLQLISPREAHWPYLQAIILSEFGRLDEAIPLFERVIQLTSNYLPAYLRLGESRLKNNRTVAAAQAFSAALVLDANNPTALLGLAKCELVQNEWEKARNLLEQVKGTHPDFIGGLSLLVTVREHFGDKAGADSLKAEIGKREFTEFPDLWRDSLFDDCYDPYLLSVAAAKANFSGDKVATRRWLERAAKFAPKDGSYRRQLGKFFLENRDFSEAKSNLEKAVGLDPDDSEAWSLLVLMYTTMGDDRNAEQSVTTGLASCPQSAALHYAYGQMLGKRGRSAEAIAEFRTAQKLRPNEANAYIDLALIYFRLERIDEAVTELKGALAAQPGHPLALTILARYAINKGDQAGARNLINQLRLQPRVPPADLSVVVNEYIQQFQRSP